MPDTGNRCTKAVDALRETARKHGKTVFVEAIIGDGPAYPLVEHTAEGDNGVRLAYGPPNGKGGKLGLTMAMDCGDAFEVGQDCIHFMADDEPGRIIVG